MSRRGRAALAAVVLLAGGLAACGDEPSSSEQADGGIAFEVVPSAPEPHDATPTVPARPAGPPAVIPGRGTLTAYVRRPVVLRARPGGRTLVRVKPKTEFGSPRVMSVVGRRGNWVAVLVPELRDRPGWLDARRGVELFRTRFGVEIDVSARRLVVRRDGREIVRIPVAVGRPATPTPPGRYAVTDKLMTEDPGASPYGCCVLALSGHQPNIVQNWGGGDRLAIHSTLAEQTIGQAASLGCLRASSGVMRRLVRLVPLGTQVRVSA